ncbi:hypothetical protein HTZ77_39530 [Nonomuraea sp. SMC257]|uniref:DUF4190 domain-containing protein n=1 Tax=Nonomuraea montanisoli TaxID=2741721 RepID=A0A7Y6IGX0_9ACTN|nr:hypothetical protein [Nonomuraea montanisoli]NUW37448.1 hypothetical protein [Nonomuraea montanisoli]
MSHTNPGGDYPYEPYGAPYGERPPPGHGHGYGPSYGPPQPPRGGVSAAALVALVLNLLAIVGCCNVLAIPGSILAGLALRAETLPKTRRDLLTWSWVLYGLGFALTISVFFSLGANGYLDD